MFDGGFLTSSQQNAPLDSPSGKKRGNAVQSIRPVTIKQMLGATQPHPDGEYRIDDAEVHQLTLVARVLTINDTSTSVVYALEDGTGMTECRYWKDNRDSDYQAQKRAAIQEGNYIRVYGVFKTFGNKRQLQAFRIHLVMDMNEVTYHALECMLTHARLKRNRAGGLTGQPNTMMADPTRMQNYGMHHGDYNPNQASYGQAAGATTFGGDLTPIQGRIYQQVKQYSDSNEGMSITYLVRQLAPEGFSEPQIRDAVDFLISEGHLYSTIDDDHCKTTDAGY